MTVSTPEKLTPTDPVSPPEPVASPGVLAVDGESEENDDDVFVFPATAAQRRLWLLDQLVPGGNPALNMPLAARLSGQLDAKILERSFDAIIRRHEVLRTTFHCEKGHLQQVISPVVDLKIPLVDVWDFPMAERAQVPDHLMVEEAQQPFDLARGPVIRARLVRLAPGEHLLFITVHHIVSDGWSNGVLLRELGELYTTFIQGKPSPLPDLPIQFADYALWQQDHADAAQADDPLVYWRKQLSGELPVLNLPADRARRVVRGRAPAGGVRRRTLSAALAQSLRALAVREGISAYMVYLTAFTILLNRYSGGQEDLLVHTPSANRDRRELEGLIGPFVNPLLLRIDLTGEPTLRELFGRIRRTVLGAFEHAVSFEKLIEEIQPRRVQANFVHLTDSAPVIYLPDLDLVTLDAPAASILGEWTVAVVESGMDTKISLAYNADLFDAETVDRALDAYHGLLAAIAEPDASEIPVSCLSMGTTSGPKSGQILLANRWRLPVESVRWMEECLDTGGALRDGGFGLTPTGISLHVLDRYRQPAPVGVPGEVYVLGPSKRAYGANTPLAWMEDPRLGPLLKTGDLARARADTCVEWIDRIEAQHFVQGLRVDLGEVETALQAHPHILEVAVLWRDGASGGGARLTAFFQDDGAPPAMLSHAQLRDFLRETLPEELIPAAFVPVERFPLTTDGRLDTAALLASPDRAAPPAEEKYDAPYLTIHYQLIEIWRELLRVPTVGIRDDFFSLGGNSLLAMRMLYKIEQACGKTLLPATLFQQATIEHLAGEILERDSGDTAPDLVRVCETGSKTPIFYLHGDLTGGGYYCMKLSRRLGPDQPFFAMPPLSGDEVRLHPTIEAMATVHLRTIRSVRPHGPYVIGGFCLGGLIAQEVARLLVAEGETVERLLIIDAEARSPRLTRFRRMAERLGRWRGWDEDRQLYEFCRWHFLAARMQRWVGLDRRQQSAIFLSRLGGTWQRIKRRMRPPETVEVAAPTATAEGSSWFDPRWDVPLLFLWAVGGFVPKPYAGATTLLLSRDLTMGTRRDPVRDWKKYNPHLTSRELVGSHLACITEHADALAETIRVCLDEPTT